MSFCASPLFSPLAIPNITIVVHFPFIKLRDDSYFLSILNKTRWNIQDNLIPPLVVPWCHLFLHIVNENFFYSKKKRETSILSYSKKKQKKKEKFTLFYRYFKKLWVSTFYIELPFLQHTEFPYLLLDKQ